MHYVNEKSVKGFRRENLKERDQIEDLAGFNVRGTGYKVVDWIELAHDRAQ
jgi:hypothetical protein